MPKKGQTRNRSFSANTSSVSQVTRSFSFTFKRSRSDVLKEISMLSRDLVSNWPAVLPGHRHVWSALALRCQAVFQGPRWLPTTAILHVSNSKPWFYNCWQRQKERLKMTGRQRNKERERERVKNESKRDRGILWYTCLRDILPCLQWKGCHHVVNCILKDKKRERDK